MLPRFLRSQHAPSWGHIVALILALLLAILFLALFPRSKSSASTHAQIIYVNDNATAPGDGNSWATAYPYLQDALLESQSGDEIWVAAGVYYPDIVAALGGDLDDPGMSFGLENGVAIYGGFAGNETMRDQRNIQANVTVLSGDIDALLDGTNTNKVVTDTVNIHGVNAWNVVAAEAMPASARLDGFTITAGKAVDNSSGCTNWCGAGLYIEGGNPTLTNLTIIGNHAFFGGGMMLNETSVNLKEISFRGNRANSLGGALYIGGGTPTIDNVEFTGNFSEGGGALYTEIGTVTLFEVIFQGNFAVVGAGIYAVDAETILVNVLLGGNRATNSAGGIYQEDGSLLLTNVTISGNQAASGAAIHSGGFTDVLAQNTIVWGNSPVLWNPPSGSTIRYSLIQALNPSGEGNLNGTLPANEPHFVSPASCGADGLCADTPATVGVNESADDNYGDLHLLPASTPLDAGDNDADVDGSNPGTLTIGDLAADLQGDTRRVAVKTLAAVVDLGAYEAKNQPPNAQTSGPFAIQEGESIALDGSASTDESSIVYAWDCTNDGTVEVTANTPTGSACAYLNSGNYTLALKVTDIFSLNTLVTTTVAVANIAPTVTPAPNQVVAATSIATLTLGSFADPGAEALWTVTVDWGDGSTPTSFTVSAPGVLPLTTHLYTVAGTYAVVVSVSDDAGSGSGTFQVTVAASPEEPKLLLPTIRAP